MNNQSVCGNCKSFKPSTCHSCKLYTYKIFTEHSLEMARNMVLNLLQSCGTETEWSMELEEDLVKISKKIKTYYENGELFTEADYE